MIKELAAFAASYRVPSRQEIEEYNHSLMVHADNRRLYFNTPKGNRSAVSEVLPLGADCSCYRFVVDIFGEAVGSSLNDWILRQGFRFEVETRSGEFLPVLPSWLEERREA